MLQLWRSCRLRFANSCIMIPKENAYPHHDLPAEAYRLHPAYAQRTFIRRNRLLPSFCNRPNHLRSKQLKGRSVLFSLEENASIGPCHIPIKAPSRASVHALHVRRRCADIQHGNQPHVALHAVQEHCGDECRCVAVLVRLYHANIPARCLLHPRRGHLMGQH